MRSFILSAFATLAFGIFCSAAPTPVAGLIDADVVAEADVLGLVYVGADVDVHVRGESPQSLQTILTGASSKVSPYADKISKSLFARILLRSVSDSVHFHSEGLDASECTVEILTPLLEDVKEILVEVVADVKALVGVAVDDILASDDGILDVDGLAKLLADLLHVCTFPVVCGYPT